MCVCFFVVCVNIFLKFEQKKLYGEKILEKKKSFYLIAFTVQYSLSTGVYPFEVQTWDNQAIKLFHLMNITIESFYFILNRKKKWL